MTDALDFSCFCLFYLSFAVAEEPEKKRENLCEKAVNQETDFQVTGIYGSPLESEWHPAAAYVLRKEMQRFEVLQREFQKKTAAWADCGNSIHRQKFSTVTPV